MKNESVLDTPRNDLDPTVWKKENGVYNLTEEASCKIMSIASWVMVKTGINNFSLHIAGSITSNQYSDKSDIDLHFCISNLDEITVDELNKEIRKDFDDEIVDDLKYIGTHKVELYFQINPFQDMMSIGCYDFFNQEWLVGPEFIPMDFDAYSEYYDEDMKHVNSIIEDIRSIILEVYELLIVLSNSKDKDFLEYKYDSLTDKLAKAALIFTKAKEFRKVYSAPTSKEDALTKRSSRDWKIADSAFKLLDKFGYLGILKECTTSYQEIQDNEKTVEQIIPNLIQVISNNIMKNPNLQNVNKQLFENIQNESLNKNLAVVSMIVSMLVIPGVTNAKSLQTKMSDIPQQHFKINDPMVTKALNDSSSNKQKFGGWSYTNLVNLLAMVAYDEGMMDYAVRENAKGKKYDDRVLQCILWTVINRAGGDPNKFAEEILKKDQYYGVKHIKNRTANTYTIQHPGIGYDRKTWEKCNEFAILAIERTLPMPKDDNGLSFGKRNMIANKQIDNKKSYDSWGRKCDFTIGGTTRHYYGYDKTWDGWGSSINDKSLKDSPNTNIPSHYIVKSGDSIYKIAKKYNISINQIKELNQNIKDINKISVGQKIKLN